MTQFVSARQFDAERHLGSFRLAIQFEKLVPEDMRRSTATRIILVEFSQRATNSGGCPTVQKTGARRHMRDGRSDFITRRSLSTGCGKIS